MCYTIINIICALYFYAPLGEEMTTIFAMLTSGIGSFFSNFMDIAATSVSGFSIIDAIDILVLTFVLFFLLRFVKGRKGGVLLIGIFILLFLTGLAHFFGLTATYYTFSLIFDVGIIAIIIIFQPEIRDALERGNVLVIGRPGGPETGTQLDGSVTVFVSEGRNIRGKYYQKDLNDQNKEA